MKIQEKAFTCFSRINKTKQKKNCLFTFDDDLTDYMTKYLPAINEYDEVKYDFLTNKNSKFLFHLFNKYQEDRGRPKYPIRHCTLSDDNYVLRTLQNQNWPYFINRIIEFLQGFINISDLTTTDAKEVNILKNTRANFEIVKNLYNELFTSVSINLHKYFKNLAIDKKQKIDTDLTNNKFFTRDLQEDFIQHRILTTYRDFYYETGRFPGRNALIPVPRATVPLFIDSNDYISPRALYESYVDRDMQGLVSVQFLATFNRFLGRDKEVSRNAMSEFFHNLSWQALTNDNDFVRIEFAAVIELVKSINNLLQKKIYNSKKKSLQIGQDKVNKILSKQIETNKTDQEKVEENIVRDILNNDQTDYTTIFIPPTDKTEEQIDQDRIEWNRNSLETELAKRERDFQIIDDIEAKNQVDLISRAIEPNDDVITNEEISQTDYNRTNNNEPIHPHLNPNVLNVIKEMVKVMQEQTSSIYDDMPALEDVPETNYEPPAILPPNLQDILTNGPPDSNLDDLIQIKEEVTDILDEVPSIKPEPKLLEIPAIIDDPITNLDNPVATLDNCDTDEIVPYADPDLDSDIDVDSDAETVPHAEQYRDTIKKDEIYRRHAKKKELKILAKKRAKKLAAIKKRNKRTNILIPTDVTTRSDNPIEILADLNVLTILPPIANNDVTFYDEDDVDFNVIDSQIVWDEDNKDLVPLELDTDKIILTDDGDVVSTEPDNMQVEEKQIVPLSDDIVMLPPEEDMADIVSTRNIVLKRKIKNNELAEIKKIKNETDILVRDVPAIESEPTLPAIESGATLPAIMPPSTDPLANVDISTMQRLPWVDFKTILDNTESSRREQVILDISQSNMPSFGDDIYYVDHDPETNTFNIKIDESADEIQNFINGILMIDAQLRLQDLSDKERQVLIKKRKMKIKELRKNYGANEAVDVLEKKLSPSEKAELEEKIIQMQNKLSLESDKYYFDFNEDTQEYELRLIENDELIHDIVAIVLKLTDKIENVNTSQTERFESMIAKENFLHYLRKKGATELADGLQ